MHALVTYFHIVSVTHLAVNRDSVSFDLKLYDRNQAAKCSHL